MFPHRSLGGLRCFVPDGTGQRVAQPLNEFSDGVDFNLFWLILRAPTGLGDISRMFPHRSRGGLRCFVPYGTGQRVAQPLNEFSDGVDFKFVLVSFARPYRAWGYLADVSPPLPLHFVQGERGGLRSFVPNGTSKRVAKSLG